MTDSSNLLGEGVSVGDGIRGLYCVDPNTPDLVGNAKFGFYDLQFHSTKIGQHSFSCISGRLDIIDDDSGRDEYTVFCSAMSSLLYSFPSSSGIIQLIDSDQTIFVDDSLPQSAPDLNEFEVKRFGWNFDDFFTTFGSVDGEIVSLIRVQ